MEVLFIIVGAVWLWRKTQDHYSPKQPLYMGKNTRKTHLLMSTSSGGLASEGVGSMFSEWNGCAGNNAYSAINPATGLPTVGGDSFGIDVGGNSYGFDNHDFGSRR